jgi:hypothetical protein
MVRLASGRSALWFGLWLGATSIVGAPAQADTGPGIGNVTGSSIHVGPITQTPQDAAQAEGKAAMARAWYAVMFGGVAPAEYEGQARAYERQYGSRAAGAWQLRPTTDVAALASPPSMLLPMAHRGQTNGYYCGPASGVMIVNYTGPSTSRYNGASLSQSAMAKDAHMATDTNGETSFSTGRFRIGLNRWREGSSTGFFVDRWTPTPTDVEVALTYDIYQHTTPFGADTVEFAGGPHYNNHPTYLTIGHWIAAYGYWNSGDNAYFKDPATTVWGGLSESFGATTSSFTNTYLQNNGITW